MNKDDTLKTSLDDTLKTYLDDKFERIGWGIIAVWVGIGMLLMFHNLDLTKEINKACSQTHVERDNK